MREILIEPVDVLIIDIENTCMHEAERPENYHVRISAHRDRLFR